MTPENKTVKSAVETATQLIAERKQLVPMFFVGNEEKHDILASPFKSDMEKNATAAMVKFHAKSIGATFILFLSEAYALTDEAAQEDYRKNGEKYNYCMGNHPKAVEVAMFQLETHGQTYVATAEIKKNRTLGELTWNKVSIKGRFSNLLSNKGTVH